MASKVPSKLILVIRQDPRAQPRAGPPALPRRPGEPRPVRVAPGDRRVGLKAGKVVPLREG